MRTIPVVFDGKAFVPTGPVDLPAGTAARVAVADVADPFPFASLPPPPMTAEDERVWEAIVAQLQATEPPWATVDEAMAYTRGRPWPDPDDLPPGTSASLADPIGPGEPVGRPPRPMTAEEEREWDEIVAQLRSVPPDPPTFDEYLRQQRGCP